MARTLKIAAGCIVAGVIGLPAIGRASVLAYEDFSGLSTSATLANQGTNNNSDGSGTVGWEPTTGHSGSANNAGGWTLGSGFLDGTVNTSNSTQLANTGSTQYAQMAATGSGGALDFRGLSSALPTTTSTTIYFWTVLQRNDTASKSLEVSLFGSNWTPTSANTGELYDMGESNGGAWTFGSAASSISSANTNLHILVGELIYNGGSSSVENLWVDPTLGGSQPTPTATATVTLSSTAVEAIRLYAGGGSSYTSGDIFQVGIGTTWADVTPEPASLAILCVPALGLLLRRRARA